MRLFLLFLLFSTPMVALAAEDPLALEGDLSSVSTNRSADPLALNRSADLAELESLLGEDRSSANDSSLEEFYSSGTSEESVPYFRLFRNDSLYCDFWNLSTSEFDLPHIGSDLAESNESFFDEMLETWW